VAAEGTRHPHGRRGAGGVRHLPRESRSAGQLW
jgi:hypothetical protein